jgi:hypothetical protein
VISFALPAIADVDTGDARPGYNCAGLSVVAVPTIGTLFRFESLWLKSTVEIASILLTAHINPLFLLYAIASPFRPADRTVRCSRIFIPLAIPLCWVLFH